MDIEVITSPVQHGEGPLWNSVDSSLYFVDTFRTTVLKWDSCTKNVTYHQLDGRSVGFLVLINQMLNAFLLCRDRNVSLFKWDGVNNNQGTLENLFLVEEKKAFNQFNDGKADAKGRLWAGTLKRNEDLSVADNGGSLYSVVYNSGIKFTRQIHPVSISNGMAWSGDNKYFFYIDSATRKIMKFNFDLIGGKLSNQKVLFDLEHYPHLKGIPDGMTIDLDNNLWVALFGGKAVIKVHSITGKLLLVKNMPVTYVTSVTFGGPNYEVLYVTTSRLKLSDEELLSEPSAGSVFAIHNLGVAGHPPDKFNFDSKKSLKKL
ncbi:hypothetical protein FQR65_LT05557 [Abscondita terminalis]|nr:hypothetical protein FQR65_LT05557 [Abscondita terminalis]